MCSEAFYRCLNITLIQQNYQRQMFPQDRLRKKNRISLLSCLLHLPAGQNMRAKTRSTGSGKHSTRTGRILPLSEASLDCQIPAEKLHASFSSTLFVPISFSCNNLCSHHRIRQGTVPSGERGDLKCGESIVETFPYNCPSKFAADYVHACLYICSIRTCHRYFALNTATL